ncbi:(R)-specific enoyl-CoA hydratase [compost metagenome]|jgi:3-hydroxybutyryl-CoA dehydratase
MSAGFFSAIFGTKIPGPGCVYVSQTLNFLRPVYIDDTVTAEVEVKKVDQEKRRVFFDTTCKVRGKKVITGSAEIYIPDK